MKSQQTAYDLGELIDEFDQRMSPSVVRAHKFKADKDTLSQNLPKTLHEEKKVSENQSAPKPPPRPSLSSKSEKKMIDVTRN